MTSSISRDRVVVDTRGPGLELFLGPLETFVMHSAWRYGETTAVKIMRDLKQGGYQITYSSVTQVLDRMTDKGLVQRVGHREGFERQRRSYIALYSHEALVKFFIGRVISALQRSYDQVLYEVWDQLVASDIARK